MPVFRDIKKRDNNKTLIINLGSKTKKNTLIVEEKKKKKKEEYVFYAVEKEKGHVRTSKNYYGNILGFALLAVFVIFVMNLFQVGNKLFLIASDVEADAFSGYQNLIAGGKDAIDSDFGGAVQYFDSAAFAFETAKNQVWFLSGKYTVGAKYTIGDTAYSLLESGEKLASAASDFTQGVSGLQEIPILFMQNNALQNTGTNLNNPSLTEKLKSSLELFNLAADKVLVTKNLLRSTPEFILPAEIKASLDRLISILDELKKRVPAILTMLGDRYPHRYLILFQNNTESRPTGGFIGSFMIVDVNDGYITNAEFKDVYDYDGQLNEHIDAPEEISALTDNWRMRDSNYSPDFSLSAQKTAWFLEKEGGPGVDTVIAINQSLLEDLLTVTGPVKVEGLEGKLTSLNYNTVLTYIIESKLEGETSPKKVLDRVIPALQENLKNPENFTKIFAIIQNEIKQKNILGWSKDENLEHFFDEIGMAGRIAKTSDKEDYFNLISINIGGNKSDLYVNTEVLHETAIDKTGAVHDIVTITRKHTWDPSVILKWTDQLNQFGFNDIPEWIQNILGRGNNKSVIKIYVPKGVELSDVLGAELNDVKSGYDAEVDKNYFYYTDEVAPQNESKVTFSYTLPNKLDLGIADEYRLTVQKQPGKINNIKFNKTIFVDPRITNYKIYPDEIIYKKGDVVNYETTLENDQQFASLWGIE